nr:cystathionine beta-synthase [Geodermatophilus normandii]
MTGREPSTTVAGSEAETCRGARVRPGHRESPVVVGWDVTRRPSRGAGEEVRVQYAESVVDLIGGTPLVRLSSVTADLGPDAPLVLAKVEYMNPGGSVKDRIAVRMVDAAEASGELKPGGTIVEPTSGNTGVGLALVAQQRGYTCVFVCPDKVSQDKVNTLRAYGAEVVVCPTAVDPSDPRSYYSVSDRLARETPGGWKPDQYANPANPRSHYETTGPEIWEQTEGRVTCFVTGVGTGGTISGIGRYLKEVSDGRVRVVGVDPEGSVYSGGTGRPYLVEGVGEDFWPEAYDRSVADDIVAVTDADSFRMTRRLAREEGLLVGGSCGMAVVGALRAAEQLGPDDVVVVLLPDGGRGYLNKIFNDRWMADYGFLDVTTGETVGELLEAKDGATPVLVHTHPNETVRDAIDILREYGVSQMPVVRAEPPVTAGEVVGSVDEKVLLDALFAGRASLSDRVEKHMSGPLPIIGSGEPVSAAVAEFGEADALVVHVDGKPAGVVTRQDVLGHLAGVTR